MLSRRLVEGVYVLKCIRGGGLEVVIATEFEIPLRPEIDALAPLAIYAPDFVEWNISPPNQATAAMSVHMVDRSVLHFFPRLMQRCAVCAETFGGAWFHALLAYAPSIRDEVLQHSLQRSCSMHAFSSTKYHVRIPRLYRPPIRPFD